MKTLKTLHPKELLLLLFLFAVQCNIFAQQDTTAVSTSSEETKDSVNKDDPNFVKVSLMIASPGDVMYSFTGHACLRLECPTYKLDYVYSYEAENADEQVLSFLAGNLKMGLYAVPTQEYLNAYKEEGRGVKQYVLNLPISVKRNLWQNMDQAAEEGANLPYDYAKRGCAKATLDFLLGALDTTQIVYAPWPEKYKQTRREFVINSLDGHPWSQFIFQALAGSDGEKDVPEIEKVLIPADLVELLQTASIDGTKIITTKPIELQPATERESSSTITPWMVSLLLLILAIVGLFIKNNLIDYLLLAIQTFGGLIMTYLILISSLPCTSWNWLIIPLNPLPLLLWKWRKHWAIYYAAVLAAYILAMVFYPHKITDTAYIIFALALMIMYLKQSQILKRFKKIPSKSIPLMLLLLAFQYNAFAQQDTTSVSVQSQEQNDSVNRDDPNFVTVSLMIASPGDVLYSRLGHTFLHLECPTYKLDYYYSYEAEAVDEKILSFLSGKLKMGMFAIPTSEYLQDYKKDGRGVKQYKLNLPIAVKRNLWQILDEAVEEGANLPYDYMERGCAQATLQFLLQAIDTVHVDYAPWPERYKQTRREFVATNIPDCHWTQFFLYTLVGTDGEKDVPEIEKVVVPTDIVELLQTAKINGTPIITDSPKVLLKDTKKPDYTAITPLMIALLILLLAIVSIFIKTNIIDYLLLAIQTLGGLFMTYLIFISKLPCTSWNWLIIPLNILPIVLWKWRKHWAIYYAGVLAVYILAMVFYPHKITDTAYIIFALALTIMYLKQSQILKRLTCIIHESCKDGIL